MENFKDSWKNRIVFEKQLELNTKELYVDMPDHWKIFLSFIKRIKPLTLLDVGCGCGAFAELLKIHHPLINYTGMDYAEEAIKLASREWEHAKFIQKNYTDLTKDDVKDFDVVSSCALHQILSNGDEAIKHFLSLEAKTLIFMKLDVTNKPSYYNVYKAYNEINTYEYFHNYGNLLEMFRDYGYSAEEVKQTNRTSHFLLRKQ